MSEDTGGGMWPAAGGGGSSLCFVIPTYNRVAALMSCMAHLERQSFADFEVIVVNDGSTDGTVEQMTAYQRTSPLRLRFVSQENAGPAKARNVAIGMTTAPVCVFIGDDILCTPSFAAAHWEFHQRNPEPKFAALGLTQWSETEQVVTPFMRWMDESGSQFEYGDLQRGIAPEWRHFYTSNLSVKTELLRRERFDERFTGGGWLLEDVELGHRLVVREGLRLVFLPEALAEHVHPTDFRKACARAYGAGVSAVMLDRIWQGLNTVEHGAVYKFLRGILCRNAWVLRPLRAVTDRLTRMWCPNPLLRPVLSLHAAVGRYEAGKMHR